MKKSHIVLVFILLLTMAVVVSGCNGSRSVFNGKKGKNCNCPNSF